MRRLASLALAVSLVLAGRVASAGPPDTRSCVEAYDGAQTHRRAGRLLQAREALLVCAQPSCPAAATRDCVPWLAEVEAALPTVIFAAHDPAGADRADVKVLLDGSPFVDTLDGRARPVDPGVHTIRLVPAGGAAMEMRLIVREGEKNRRVEVTLGAPAVAPKGAAPLEGSGAAAEAPPSRPVPPAVWAVGGVGLAGLAAFGVVGAISLAAELDLRNTCAPYCDPSKLVPIRAEHTAADVSLGVGVAALAVAAGLFFARPVVRRVPVSARSPAIDLRLSPGLVGGTVILKGVF